MMYVCVSVDSGDMCVLAASTDEQFTSNLCDNSAADLIICEKYHGMHTNYLIYGYFINILNEKIL